MAIDDIAVELQCFLVMKEQDSTFSRLNLPLLSVFKGQALKAATEENIYK